jgi:hypothetical protein
VRYPKFPGTGFLALPTLRGADREFVIDMDFRPDNPAMTSKNDVSRLMLYGAERPDAISDFFSVSLTHDGHVEFRYGITTVLMASGSNFWNFGSLFILLYTYILRFAAMSI